MICVDDLRPLLGCYGHADMQTPNMDRLANEGVRFSRTYCQVPVCGASRASLMTGIRPTRERFTTFFSRADEDAPGVPTLLHSLKENGYRLVGNPKVLHEVRDHADVWDEYLKSDLAPHPGPYHNPHTLRRAEEAKRSRDPNTPPWVKGGPAWECEHILDDAQHDGNMVDRAIQQLQSLARDGKPFAMGYGSISVHLPFKAPKPYWDLYPPESIPMPDHQHSPADVPEVALHNWQELRNYVDMPAQGPLSDDTARTLIRGYRAGVSYLDAQIGKLLDELDRTGLADYTTVVLWADHGFNLGEHGLWCKHCLYEPSLHVPLLIRPPTGSGFRPGTVVHTVVENLDVFPTVCELMGLPVPAHVQGKSLVPLMRETTAQAHTGTAYSRYFDGESVRTDRYRYSEWLNSEGAIYARTLFDLKTDPAETQNLIGDQHHTEIANELSANLAELRESKGATREA